MSELIAGEAVFFHRWETSEYVQYDAIVRTCEDGTSPEVNLNWFGATGNETPVNNVKNVEDPDLVSQESYWRGKYGDVVKARLLEIGNSYLDTVRVENGDMVLFRPWDSATFWVTCCFGIVVSTLGAPSDPHPRINLRYIDPSGNSVLVAAVNCLEKFSNEDDAQGNDIWTNIPYEFLGL